MATGAAVAGDDAATGGGATGGTDPAPAHIALVGGRPVLELPVDLYIPPDALEVFLETFEGPLDLLLYLIKRRNLDILAIPIAEITAQYLRYIGLMEQMRFELAAEYLLMAAMLAEIKSRMLLPRTEEGDDDEDDPRAELVRRLQEYERIKEAAEHVDALPRMERDTFQASVASPPDGREVPVPDVMLRELLLALRDVAERARLQGRHEIVRETLSVRARMSAVLAAMQVGGFCEFRTLFDPDEGRAGVVVTFLAILELCKGAMIDIVQSGPFAPIHLKLRTEPMEGEERLGAATAAGPDASADGEGAGGEDEESAYAAEPGSDVELGGHEPDPDARG